MPSRFRDSFFHGIAAYALPIALTACHKPSPPLGSFSVTLDRPAPSQISPPDGALWPWRVWIDQEEPRQKKAPEWRAYAAKEAASLDIAADGTWRCLINPVRVKGKTNEHGKTSDWIVTRTIRCSSDAWRSYVEGFAQADFDVEGKETEATASAALRLSEVVSGVRRNTVVVLEGEKATRQPSFD
jgi:hypothetical protein